MVPEDSGVLEIVFSAVDELNAMLPDDRQLEKASSTVLLGEAGTLSSLEFVHLIVAAEGQIEDRLSVSVSLANERAMSLRNSPFRTVGSLVEYASELLKEKHP